MPADAAQSNRHLYPMLRTGYKCLDVMFRKNVTRNQWIVMITFPLWFKILLGLFSLNIVFVSIIFLIKEKMINYYNEFPHEKKRKLVNYFSIRMKIQKIIICIFVPINVFFMPYFLYNFAPTHFYHFTILVVVLSVGVIISFFYIKAVLSGLKT